MASFFNPGNPKWNRGVYLLSVVVCTAVGSQLLIADFGGQEHIFSPIHRYTFPIIDAYFNVSEEELKRKPMNRRMEVVDPKSSNEVRLQNIENKIKEDQKIKK